MRFMPMPTTFKRAKALINCGSKIHIQQHIFKVKVFFQSDRAALFKNPVQKGTFSFRVPLKHIFGFCDDYEKVVYGLKHQLTLVRKRDNDTIFRNGAADAGKVVLTKPSWYMLHVLPEDAKNSPSSKQLSPKASIPVMYWMVQCDSIPVFQTRQFTYRLPVKSSPENPRWIIVGFQTNKNENQEQNPSIFDHCNFTCMFVMLK